MSMVTPPVDTLVLDAGPLLSLAPLRGLAARYVTVPQVLGELKDQKAREHFEKLRSTVGVYVEVRDPNSAALAKVTLAAKKSGDYSVLSAADLSILAITSALHDEAVAKAEKSEIGKNEATTYSLEATDLPTEGATSAIDIAPETQVDPVNSPGRIEEDIELQALAVNLERTTLDGAITPNITSTAASEAEHSSEPPPPPPPIYDDPISSDDGEGEWITPSNVGIHKSRALDLLPQDAKKTGRLANEKVQVGCMTADFAMQNVLLHMGLDLVGVEGKRITRIKSWILRCHACFKLCKDPSKKFCPSCGNPSLLRTSITTTAPDPTDPSSCPKVQIHLKKNFQYKLRGTKYSVPMPKPGSSKTGTGTGIILREDQSEYMKAVNRERRREERDAERLMRAAADPKGGRGTVKVGQWDDPDWIPDMLVGVGKRQAAHGLPTIGMGRKNPNEKRRRK